MNSKKMLIQRIVMIVMLFVTVVSVALATTFIIKNKQTNQLLLSFQENSIIFTETQFNSLNDDTKDYFILTVKDEDQEFKLYILDIEDFDLDIYTALILSGSFNQSDFSTFDGTNFYFENNDPKAYAKTDVLELQDDPDYYDIEWGTLIRGLQDIIIDKNYTVVKGVWEQ